MPLMIAPQGIHLSIKRVMGNDKVRRYLEALGLVPNQSIPIRSRFLSCRKSLRSLLFDLSDRKQIAVFEAISKSFVILIRLGNNGKKRRKKSRSAGWLQSYASAREVHFLTLFWWIKTVQIEYQLLLLFESRLPLSISQVTQKGPFFIGRPSLNSNRWKIQMQV